MKKRLLHRQSFTLIELLIVVGIIAILAAATIPSFGSFTERKAVLNSIDELMDDIMLVRNKSLAGAVVADKPVYWRITIDGGTENYSLGYQNADGTEDNTVITKSLAVGAEFSSCVPVSDCTLVFKRLSGKRKSGTTDASQDITIKYNSRTWVIHVYEMGKIYMEEK